MQVFITGGTGLIGTGVVAELLAHGHTVLALARSDTSAAKLQSAGAEPLRGGLGDVDVLRAAAARADGVIHLAMDHDFSSADTVARAVAEETAGLLAMGDELIGSNRPLVACSGTPWIAGRVSVESDEASTDGPVGGRNRTVNAILDLASQGVRSSAVRLPRTVHRDGRGGFAGIVTDIARRDGVAGYPGDGSQRWPAVHALDAAVLFRLALESSPAGRAWHAVGEEAVAVRDIATVIGRRLGLPVEAVPEANFGPLGAIFAMDQPSSSALTRDELGWQPTHVTLLEDLENLENLQPAR